MNLSRPLTILLVAVALLPVTARDAFAGYPDQPLTLDAVKTARKQAAHRKRRIVMDNDGNEVVYLLREASAKSLLDARTTALLGTQVDTIVYCTWSSGFGLFTHNTKVGQVFTCTEQGFEHNKTAEFIAQGTDSLEIVTDFCRKNDVEIFWSMRMNDTHDAWNAWYSPLMFPELKKAHPEFLVASRKKRSKVGGWSAVDYARPEIRDLAFAYVEEVCRNYDVDGVVLDYFRHPVYFKSHAMGGVAGREELDMLTEMMQRIRRMADEVGAQRGRPLLITARVPDSVEYCNAMGIDIEAWLAGELIDLLAVSGYFRLNPWAATVALGRKYDVPVLACLSESRLKDDAGRLRNSLPCYRGRAMNAWAAGVDGVYTFNFFDANSPLWQEIGEPKTMQPLERLYTTGARGVKVINRWMVKGERFLNRDVVSPEQPRLLPDDETIRLELDVSEQPNTLAGRAITLEIRVVPHITPDKLSVSLNGHKLSNPTATDQWTVFPVDSQHMVAGMNHIHITAGQGAERTDGPKLLDLLLRVR